MLQHLEREGELKRRKTLDEKPSPAEKPRRCKVERPVDPEKGGAASSSTLLDDADYQEVWVRYHFKGRGYCRDRCVWRNEFPPSCKECNNKRAA